MEIIGERKRWIFLLAKGEKGKKCFVFTKLIIIFAELRGKNADMITFQLVFMEEAKNFLQSLPEQAYKKVLYNMDRVAGGERNRELFKKLGNSDIWEFRTLYNGISYRLFAFWDTDKQTLVIATHGLIKKTQKTPKKEIAKAEAIMKQYFELKR